MPNHLRLVPPLHSTEPQLLNLDPYTLNPQPPAVQRSPPHTAKDKIPPSLLGVGVNFTLKGAIDYDKLTPTQQAKWDFGMYGSIELKPRGIYHYYYLRWRDKTSGKYRSTYLAKDWDEAIAKLRRLTIGDR